MPLTIQMIKSLETTNSTAYYVWNVTCMLSEITYSTTNYITVVIPFNNWNDRNHNIGIIQVCWLPSFATLADDEIGPEC
jgi:predicted MarR family transcription regulator